MSAAAVATRRSAAAGEEIIIAKAGRPVARLVPLAAALAPRIPGGWEGQVWMAEDFDAELAADELAAWYDDDAAKPLV
jgi:antitoxin (DNA-binding transcriptional repressor) of toxin-antitoxin stability system